MEYFFYTYDSWSLGFHLIGFLIPFVIATATLTYLVWKKNTDKIQLLIAIMAVSIISIICSVATVDKGVVTVFPLTLFPSIASLLFKDKNQIPYSYSITVISIVICDFVYLPSLLTQSIPTPMHAVIGGAGIYDMIFVSGFTTILLHITADTIRKLYKRIRHTI